MEPLGRAFGQQFGTSETKLEAKLRLEAGLEGRLEAKLRLEASLEASGRGSKRQVALGEAASCAWRAAGSACWVQLGRVGDLHPLESDELRDILAEHYVGYDSEKNIVL